MNKLVLTGRVGGDAEVRTNSEGKATVATWSMAVEEREYSTETKKMEKVTSWFNCVAFGYAAASAQATIRKGAIVSVDGRLKIDKVERDGETKYYTKCVVNDISVELWPSRSENSEATEAGSAPDYEGEDEDEFPF